MRRKFSVNPLRLKKPGRTFSGASLVPCLLMPRVMSLASCGRKMLRSIHMMLQTVLFVYWAGWTGMRLRSWLLEHRA